ncbi:MAG: FCD domain-containing protein [Rhizobiales bacterium]|nr:FCD domain-containing protein [Hyphomicrobiales bacterium]NRB14303.1 FCD domain-containing protein [Hyphomicrobiales bacterium]
MGKVITAAEIAKILAASVHDGELSAGDMYPSERILCEQYGVGRNVVRESFTILQGMTLADHNKGKRPRVLAPSLGQVMEGLGETAGFFFNGSEGNAHLEQARLFLETSMLRYAVVHATNAQIAKMVSAIEECDKHISDIEGFRNADVKFHRVLAEVPGNPIFVALHATFVERLMKNRPVLDDFATLNKSSNDEHKKIVEAILDKEADKAVEILTCHLTRNYGSYFRQALARQMTNGAR